MLVEGFKNDAVARSLTLPTGPLIDLLQKWPTQQLVEKFVEPNSGLGRVIALPYVRFWNRLRFES
jgi:hypothetical protein